MTITLTPALRQVLSLTMIAVAIITTGLSASIGAGVLPTDGATLGACAVVGALLGVNLTLVWVSVIERRTHRRQHDPQSSPASIH
ncbi:hypothetical protein [Rhodococcus sp. 14-2470-1a]|uniref:hypothetical protein n=1 Tax=Rhodococcus sp. 14-2470-1a TaxID=2023150 RepID=UPI000B9B56FD|nr:hypothetical protein [Rhodococcus sp. 14-2470-1a]OZF42099.1 hypothetical protein CH292_26780 [Rhodococcus sp. 14-2470-1a]